MWKLVGAVLVAAGSGWLGLSAASGLTRRLRAVQAMISGLELLERELWERGAALPELMAALSRRCTQPAADFFQQCAKGCARLDQVPFGESWRQAVDGLELLSPEARAALLPLGEVLGRYEADSQRQALEHARQALEREELRAEEERRRLGRVYQALGLSGGAFLVILLL